MKGIQFLVDKKGKKKSVLIDLQEHGDIWEDFFDSLTARSRAHEERESLAEVRKSLPFVTGERRTSSMFLGWRA